MTPANLEQLINNTVVEVRQLLSRKGGEYAPGSDTLANFKNSAVALGLQPEVIWAIYAQKHWDSIRTYVADLTAGKERERTEPIEGRLLDLMAYCVLGLGLVEDRKVPTKVDEMARFAAESMRNAMESTAWADKREAKDMGGRPVY